LNLIKAWPLQEMSGQKSQNRVQEAAKGLVVAIGYPTNPRKCLEKRAFGGPCKIATVALRDACHVWKTVTKPCASGSMRTIKQGLTGQSLGVIR
jgi:hypothetical protein